MLKERIKKGTNCLFILIVISQVLALSDIACRKYTNSCVTINTPIKLCCMRLKKKENYNTQMHTQYKFEKAIKTSYEPLLHFCIRTTAMIDVSGFVSFISGINHHISINFAQVKICFPTVFHLPKPVFTCFIIYNCKNDKLMHHLHIWEHSS